MKILRTYSTLFIILLIATPANTFTAQSNLAKGVKFVMALGTTTLGTLSTVCTINIAEAVYHNDELIPMPGCSDTSWQTTTRALSCAVGFGLLTLWMIKPSLTPRLKRS